MDHVKVSAKFEVLLHVTMTQTGSNHVWRLRMR